MKYSLVTHH